MEGWKNGRQRTCLRAAPKQELQWINVEIYIVFIGNSDRNIGCLICGQERVKSCSWIVFLVLFGCCWISTRGVRKRIFVVTAIWSVC
jgi:hypothetical protein